MEDILRDGMKYDFERIDIIHELTDVMAHFSVYAIMYKQLYKCRYTYKTLFLCLQREEAEETKCQNQQDQQNIILNNQITISPTSDE